MVQNVKVLVSNVAIPTSGIGSWTTRMSRFLESNPFFFDFILSPNDTLVNSIKCKKRPFFTWKEPLRKLQLLHWVAFDYIHQLKRLSLKYDKLVIVVMDDPHLIEACVLIKSKLKCKVELIFSFHGFQLHMKSDVLTSIDKVFFLSQLGFEQTKKGNVNIPQSFIIGNAVDSKIFYPLTHKDFIKARLEKNYGKDDKILIWMANDRPKKGFHIFKAVVHHLLEIHKELKIIIIGSSQTIAHKNVNAVGRIANSEVSEYLQIGNYYMFTTLYDEGFGLSMIEALKCGNTIIASNRGAIPEVLSGLERTYLIENPEDLNSWVECFNLLITRSNFDDKRLTRQEANSIWNYEDWELKFKNAIAIS